MWELLRCLPSLASNYGTGCRPMKRASLPPDQAGARPAAPTRPSPSVSSICPKKPRLTKSSGTPKGGRKDVLHWAAEGEKPVAELEIDRPGDEISPSRPARTAIGDRLDPNGGRQLERAAISCILSRLMLLPAGNDRKLAELFARAEL